MRKLIGISATGLFLLHVVYILPTFSYSKKFFVSRYNPSAKELMIIQDVYEKMYLPTKLSLWVIVVMYLLFVALYFVNKGPSPK